MKTAWVFLLACTLTASAQLRLYGTNTLVDFSFAQNAGPDALRPDGFHGLYSNYWVCGDVIGRIGQSVVVARETGELRYYYRPSDLDYVDTRELLRTKAAIRLSGTNGVGYAQFMCFEPLMQARFELRPYAEPVLVMRAPAHLKKGNRFQACALNTGLVNLSPGQEVVRFGIAGTPRQRTIPAFDMGTEFRDVPSTNFQLFIAAPKGLVRKK